MKVTRICLLIASLLVQQISVNAQEKTRLYKWVDDEGVVHYSDEPQAGAKQIEIEEVPTIQMGVPHIEKRRSNNKENETAAKNHEKPYSLLAISTPSDNGIVRNNGSFITLSAEIEPALRNEHQVQIFLDGRPVSQDPKSLSVTVKGVQYGAHTAKIVIIDKSNKPLQSSKTNKFHYLHVLKKKNSKPKI